MDTSTAKDVVIVPLDVIAEREKARRYFAYVAKLAWF
jgi:hypothetical protein